MLTINSAATLEIIEDLALVTLQAPPVNALTQPLRDGLRRGVETADADPQVKAILILCAGKGFIAGADISEFGKPPASPVLADVLMSLEGASKPVIACLHGAALGGGFEVALAAHYRIATPEAKLGLPELKLGLIPGGGGTQRLPRLVGVAKALEMILSAAPLTGREALACGAVDALADQQPLREAAMAFARTLIAQGAGPRRLRDVSVTATPEIFASARQDWKRKNRGQIAWEKAIEAVQSAVDLPFDAGLQRERALFTDLRDGDQSQALRYAFFAERQAGKVSDLPAGIKPRLIGKVGVIGAGTMGSGIAMVFRNAGLPVVLVETSQAALDRGVQRIRETYEGSLRKGKLTGAEVEARLAGLTGTIELADLSECDLVIEAVFEDLQVKKDLVRQLNPILRPGAIFATNTSYLDVDVIAGETLRPEDVVGLHFFSPAPIMRLLEIVRTAKTSPDVLVTALSLAKILGKVAVVVGVCYGFVGNRILQARHRQAAQLLAEGAMPWDVDRVLTEFGFPMGPFAMSDLAGVDIGWLAASSSSSTIKEILCEQGRKGQKTGGGYYDYDAARRASPSALVEQIIVKFSADRGITRRAISDEEIRERCLFAMINEGARILSEKIAQRASDIDVVWLTGYGFPAWRGGLMYYADQLGLPFLHDSLKRLAGVHGSDFEPAPLLAELAASNGRFISGNAD